MEKIIHLHIEKLPEGMYLATSDEVPGLIAPGRTRVSFRRHLQEKASQFFKR